MKRDYELSFILNPEVSEERTGTILSRLSQIIANYDGQVVRVNQWGRRRMAYPIEHHRDGFYVFIDMILTPETVTELDRTLKVSEDVLRHMLIRRDPKVAKKEREDFETRAAQALEQQQKQAASANAAAAASDSSDLAVVEMPAEEAEATENDKDQLLVELSPEEIENIPPAIEEDEADSVEV